MPLTAGVANAAFPGLNGRIVFASNRTPLLAGEVYSVAAAGGPSRRVTSNRADEGSPVASPVDGRIAFVRAGWISVRTSQGRVRAVARVRELRHGPLWSFDGKLLLYTAGSGDQLAVFVVPASGAKPRRRIGTHLAYAGAPAWSPDGRRVAIVGRDSHLYAVAVSTGRRTRLTRGRQPDWDPAWSPDGSRLAFFRLGRRPALFVVRLSDRRLRRLSFLYPGEGAVLAWSPRAEQLLVARSDVGSIHLVSLRGRDRLLARSSASPTWSPDGHSIAYRSRPTGDELWVMRADGARKHRLVRLPQGHRLLRHSWTADSRRVVYGRFVEEEFAASDLYTIRPDGSGVRALTHTPANESAPSFSPDGTQVAYLCGTSLCVLDRTTGASRRLASGLHPYAGPSWSPDGSRLVFGRLRPNRGNPDAPFSDLYVVGADGSGLSPLTAEAYAPSWSPDGRRIAFSRIHEYGENLHVLDLGDGSERNISNQPWWDQRFGFFDTTPDWSPSGDALVMASMRGLDEDGGCDPACPPSDVFTLPPAGGEVRRLTSTQNAFEPAWSPDGRFVVYDTAGRITVVGRAGGRPRRLTRGPGSDLAPSWQPRCTRQGTADENVIPGTASDDLLCGLGGNDTLAGGAGSDRLFGGRGADSLHADDGEWDIIGCGPGRDVAFADGGDLVGVDCEQVVRP